MDSRLTEELLAHIPGFPDSRQILLEDKPLFDAIFAANPPEISEYTFTNIFAWSGAYNSTVSRFGSHILVINDPGDHLVSMEPLGNESSTPVFDNLISRSQDKSLIFERISAGVAASLREHSNLIVEPNRNDWDYLYLADDLINLAGRKFDAKRNFINRMKLHCSYEYVVMNSEVAHECVEFSDLWCEQKSCDTVEGLKREQCAIYRMLSNFEALRIRGGAIRMDGAIVAFSLGEALNPETLVIHAEKADARIDGLYQLINNEFCTAEACNFTYVNREQDLGIPGLRKAKQSYHPVRMIETFRVRSPNLE